jgi:hypothetical protein
MTDDLWLKPKPTRLTNLKIREVSSVDRGAGEDVKVAFWKSDDDDGERARNLPTSASSYMVGSMTMTAAPRASRKRFTRQPAASTPQ